MTHEKPKAKRGPKRALSAEQAQAIIASRKSLDRIALEFGISKTLACHIRRGTSRTYSPEARRNG